jgi:hypothetical protein
MRTEIIIQKEIDVLAKELRLLKEGCECRLFSLYIFPHQKRATKKCLTCSKSVTMNTEGEEFRHEWEGLNNEWT